MFAWEVEVPPIAGDNSAPLNAAIADLVNDCGGGTIYLAPAVYPISEPILRKSNVFIRGAFKGAGLWDATVSKGTIIRWNSTNAGNVFTDQPTGPDTRIVNGGISDLTIDGAGLAKAGLSSLNSYFAVYARIHCIGTLSYAYYFGTLNTAAVEQNRLSHLQDLSAVCVGATHGIYLGGYPGPGRNTCFMSASNCSIEHLNGHGFVIANGDDNVFTGCSASRGPGGSGRGISFGSDGSGAATAFGNQFYGFWSNGGYNAVPGSRGNIVYTSSVDGLPLIYGAGSSDVLTVVSVAGEAGLKGFVRNPLPAG